MARSASKEIVNRRQREAKAEAGTKLLDRPLCRTADCGGIGRHLRPNGRGNWSGARNADRPAGAESTESHRHRTGQNPSPQLPKSETCSRPSRVRSFVTRASVSRAPHVYGRYPGAGGRAVKGRAAPAARARSASPLTAHLRPRHDKGPHMKSAFMSCSRQSIYFS